MKVPSMLFVSLLLLAVPVGCQSDEPLPPSKPNPPAQRIGGPCEDCSQILTDLPDEVSSIDTSLAWHTMEPQLKISGQVYELDGQTPVANCLLYYWQTNEKGLYELPEKHRGVRSEKMIRGWVKTDAEGRYTIYTARPQAYPGRQIPAHIHVVVQEPELPNEYYIDDFVFDDDPLLTTAERRKMPRRGGSGVLRLLQVGTVQAATHNIILGLNIPGHPANTSMSKGLKVGEDVHSFTPYHAYGRDQGSKACPVCKYGRYHGVLFFMTDVAAWEELLEWVRFFEKESGERAGKLKVYVVVADGEGYEFEKRKRALEGLGAKLDLEEVALTFVPDTEDQSSGIYLNEIDPNQRHTLIVYRQSNVIAKWVNQAPDEANFNSLKALLDRTTDAYFNYPQVGH